MGDDLRKCQTLISTFDSVHWWQALTASYLQHVSTHTLTHSARKSGKVRFERRTAHRERKSKLAQGRFGPGEPSACLPEWNCHCWEQSEPGSSRSRPKLPQAAPSTFCSTVRAQSCASAPAYFSLLSSISPLSSKSFYWTFFAALFSVLFTLMQFKCTLWGWFHCSTFFSIFLAVDSEVRALSPLPWLDHCRTSRPRLRLFWANLYGCVFVLCSCSPESSGPSCLSFYLLFHFSGPPLRKNIQ